MSLTPEIIKANEALASLSEDQITAIATLSVNDEATVINTKIGELHGRYDQDVETVTGVKKNQGEKSYDFVKRVLGSYKEKADAHPTLTAKTTELETEISTLKQQIADGKGNEAMKQQLTDAQSQLKALKTQYDTEKMEWGTKEQEFNSKMTAFQVNGQFEKATSGLKFKAGYPESVQSTLIDSAKTKILAQYKPDWVEVEGKKVMVFRDEKGEIVRNKANALNPYTAEELMTENLKEVLDLGQQQKGGGTGPLGGKDKTIEVVDIAGAKTQVEADEIIVKYLMQIGETRGTASFAEKQAKLRTDNNVSKLPMR